MKNCPLVSIVTPSFNQAYFIEATINSVLAQTYKNIEYIIVDGGSSDGTFEIIKKYEGRLAYWTSEKDSGYADAVRKGMLQAKGEILAYLNSDDLLAPDAVERAVQKLTQHPQASFVYGNRVCIDALGHRLYVRPSLPILANSAFASMIIPQETCFWRRSAYDKVGGIRSEFRFAADYDLFARLGRHGKGLFSGAIWGFFRRHDHSKTTTQYATLGKAEVAKIQVEVFGKGPSRVMWLIILAIARIYTIVIMPFLGPKLLPESISWKRRVSLFRIFREIGLKGLG
jgi:glycosyltransferase involved in cell wall biosynthesis